MSVEFLPSHQPDEHADEPGPAPGGPRRNLWWLAVALLVGAATVWAVVRPSPPNRVVAAPTTTTARHADPACRNVPDCSVSETVPAAVDQVVRSYLPAGVQLHVHSVLTVGSLTLRNQLVARDIEASADSVTVLIRIRRGGSGTHAIAPDPLGIGSLLLHAVNSGYVVRLQYLAPETVPPALGRLRTLIRDPRITAAAG
jgi:hypothetical protein